MAEFSLDGMNDDENEEIGDTIPHRSPNEIGFWCIDDPGFIEELDRRFADDSESIPWSEIRKAPISRPLTD
jgi:hypothetical protein